jgi:CYTH domain-containing protein
VEASSGDHVVFKLTQKFADASSLTRRTTIITTFYLNELEYQRLAVLGGHEVTKRRYRYVYEGYTWVLDAFTGRHEGLMLAEVEGENEDELERVVVPPFVGWEVTNDPFFTGGALAVVTTADFRRILAERLAGNQPIR